MDKKEAENFADKNGISYVEVSAKNATNISLLFRKVAENLIESKKAVGGEGEGEKDQSQQSVDVSNNITLTKEGSKGVGEDGQVAGCKC